MKEVIAKHNANVSARKNRNTRKRVVSLDDCALSEMGELIEELKTATGDREKEIIEILKRA